MRIKSIIIIVFSFFVFNSCSSFLGKGNLIVFRELNNNKFKKLIKVFIRHDSSTETSDYWNVYTIEVINAQTKEIEFTNTYTCNDARNDKGLVLCITNEYVWLDADELVALSINQKDKVLKFADIKAQIENTNPELKNNIGEIGTYNVNYISVISKKANNYFINPNNFKAYLFSTKGNNEVPDSVRFNAVLRAPINNIFGPNGTQRVLINDSLVYSLENDDINATSKSFLYSFKYELMPQRFVNSTNGFVTTINSDTSKYVREVNLKTRIQLQPDPFLIARFIGIVSNAVYIIHDSEIGTGAKPLLTRFNVLTQKADWTIDLSLVNYKGENYSTSTEVWSEDFKSLYFLKYNTQDSIYKIDAETGKKTATY